MNRMPTIGELLADPCTPYWLREVLVEARKRDPVDAAAGLRLAADAISADPPAGLCARGHDPEEVRRWSR